MVIAPPGLLLATVTPLDRSDVADFGWNVSTQLVAFIVPVALGLLVLALLGLIHKW